MLLYDKAPEQVSKGLALVDKLLAKDASKGRITSEEVREARERIRVVGAGEGVRGMRDVDMVIEVSDCCRVVKRL